MAVIDVNEELQRMLRCMEETLFNELIMKINTKKTKFLVCCRNNNIKIRIPNLQDNREIQQVEEFSYLGSIISKDGKCKKEIIKRICQVKTAFNKKKWAFYFKKYQHTHLEESSENICT